MAGSTTTVSMARVIFNGVSVRGRDTEGVTPIRMSRLLNSTEIIVFCKKAPRVTAALRGGNNICGALIGPGVQASHNIERTHRLGLENTLELLKGYLEV